METRKTIAKKKPAKKKPTGLTAADLKERIASPDWRVRRIAAYHAKATPSMLDKLSKDMAWQVRTCVAKHKRTKPFTLERLSYDTSYRVVLKVCDNENTPLQVLDRLLEKAQEQNNTLMCIVITHNLAYHTKPNAEKTSKQQKTSHD